MLIQLFLICLFRYATESIVNTYNGEAMYCNQLLEKAKATQVESVRNAYCVEVVEADHKAVLNTLNEYHLSILASNQTYSTFAEVLNYSCRIPSWLEIWLRWTSGVLPLSAALFVYRTVQFIRVKMKRTKVYVAPPETVESEEEQVDAPPISKSRTVRQDMYMAPNRVKTPEVKQKKKLSSNTEALLTMTPQLRHRILAEQKCAV